MKYASQELQNTFYTLIFYWLACGENFILEAKWFKE